jgi:hypothetical protein
MPLRSRPAIGVYYAGITIKCVVLWALNALLEPCKIEVNQIRPDECIKVICVAADWNHITIMVS